jgi:hypothetical protein
MKKAAAARVTTRHRVDMGEHPRRMPIASWGIDDLIVQQVAAALSIRFQVQPVTYPRATFATTQESPVTAVNLVRGDPFKKLVKTEVSLQGLDAYIVITKAKAYFGGGNRKVEGVGLITYLQHGSGIIRPAPCALRDQSCRRQDVRHHRKTGRQAA